MVQLGQALAFFGDERGEVHEKKNGDRPRGGAITVSATDQLSLFDAGRFDRAVAAGELLDATGGVDELLFACEERMAGRANADLDVPAGRAGVVDGPAGAGDRGFGVIGMETGFHGIKKVGNNAAGRTGVQALSAADLLASQGRAGRYFAYGTFGQVVPQET
jgi:hypothetical protein